jgi:hypothetical protein
LISYAKKGEWLEVPLHFIRSGHAPQEERTDVSAALRHLGIPERLIRKLRAGGGIRLSGNRLSLRLFPEEQDGTVPEWHDLQVLYEDDFTLVVHKPAGMPVHPVRSDQQGTLANAVASYYDCTGQRCKIRHIHRLDEDTTGPVLYAKHEFSQVKLDEAMRLKKIGRTYAAVVHGVMKERAGTIRLPIGRDRHHPVRRRVSRITKRWNRTGLIPLSGCAWRQGERIKSACISAISAIPSLETGCTADRRIYIPIRLCTGNGWSSYIPGAANASRSMIPVPIHSPN